MRPGPSEATATGRPQGSTTMAWPALAEAAVVVLAVLGGGDDVALVLDGAGAEEGLPVILAGRLGEGGGDGGTSAPPSASRRWSGEAQVVAVERRRPRVRLHHLRRITRLQVADSAKRTSGMSTSKRWIFR